MATLRRRARRYGLSPINCLRGIRIFILRVCAERTTPERVEYPLTVWINPRLMPSLCARAYFTSVPIVTESALSLMMRIDLLKRPF